MTLVSNDQTPSATTYEPSQIISDEQLLATLTRLLLLEKKSLVSKTQPSLLRGTKSVDPDDKQASTFDLIEVQQITPIKISEELRVRAHILYTLLTTLLKKPNEDNDSISLKQRVGLAASVLLNLTNQELNVYSAKLGVMLIAAGLPNSAVNMLGKMGVCCSSDTVRNIIKKAGMNTDSIIRSIVSFQKSGKKTVDDLNSLLENLKTQPYIYIGVNKVPHKLIYNRCGGISIGNKSQSYEEPEQRQPPRTVLVIDNYNVQIGNARWGKEQKIDVVHALGKIQEIYAPEHLSRSRPSIPLHDLTEKHLLPNKRELDNLEAQFVEISMAVLAEREPKLSFMKRHLPNHVSHDNSDVMSLGSVLVTLGIIDENQTTTAGTIKILNECLKYTNDEGITWVAGDQLTQERTQNAKIALASVLEQSKIQQMMEYDGNFHTQITLLTATMKLVHSEQSKLEKSSFTGCCHSSDNAKAATFKVKDSFTKTWRAFDIYWQAMLHSAWLEMVNDHGVEETITSTLESAGPLAAVTQFRQYVDRMVKNVLKFQEEDWVSNIPILRCRNCSVTKQNRVLLAKHMMQEHEINEEVAERMIRDDYSHLKLDDPRYNYGRLIIFLGLLNKNLALAISYGDGERETLTLKFTIPIFRRMGHTKYSYMQVKRQIMLQSVFSEAVAFEYRHNTTIGIGVGEGKRKANDYVLELMNNFLSSAKGRNFTKETMITAADALSFLHTIRKSVEDDLTGVHRKKGSKAESQDTYRDKVLPKVKSGNFFKFESGRKAIPGLRVRRNIYNDCKTKKTLVQFMREAITNSKKSYAKYSTFTIEDMAGEELIDEEEETIEETSDDESEDTDETVAEELIVNCLDASINTEDDFLQKRYNAVVVQPEVLNSAAGQKVVRIIGSRCLLFVIDEAHCIKKWGKSSKKGSKPFRKMFKDIASMISKFENRPLVLCLTATLTELNEKETLCDLGLDPTEILSISKNPVNHRISMINLPGCLDIKPLLSMLEWPEDKCPRVIIFENSLVDCGYRYLEFKQALNDDVEKISRVEVFHSQIPDSKQEEIAADLMNINGHIKFVIATSALSMGFDAAGRAGRSDGFKAYCVVFTKSKTRDMDRLCDLYRNQKASCRRVILAGCFKGEMEAHSNENNDTCCDVCQESRDPLIQAFRDSLNTQQISEKEMRPRRRVKREDREFFTKALQCQLTLYSNTMPFIDCELTEGVIKKLTEECGYIYDYNDLENIIPGLSSEVKEDIIAIAREIFKF
ncbi:hypothetical protein ACHWQZ_G015565 [Mnemiopsis leidyi]